MLEDEAVALNVFYAGSQEKADELRRLRQNSTTELDFMGNAYAAGFTPAAIEHFLQYM